MEPMTLGSPVNSPTIQPGPGGPAAPGTGFLPGFLMGDQIQQGRMLSPTKNVVSSPKTPSTPMSGGVGGGRAGFLTPSTPSGSAAGGSKEEKPGGPPTSGLFSTPKNLLHRSVVDPSTPNSSLMGFPPTPRGQMSTPIPTTPHLSFGASQTLNETVNQSTCQDGTTWVTVFGFPPSAASFILQQFSQCGTVLQHHSPASGNWMQIRYQTRTQAQAALSKSGRILGGTLMIGVKACQDPPAMLSDTADVAETTMNNTSFASKSMCIRPLTKSYKTAQNEHELSMTSTSASRNDGVVSRAMEYIFGW